MDESTTALVATAVGSGALTAAVTAWFASRGKRDDREQAADARRIVDSGSLISELLQRLDSKEALIADLSGKMLESAAEITDLRARLEVFKVTSVPANGASLLEGWLDTLPWPCWVHAVGRNAWHLNRTYCKEFHVPRESFWQPVNILAGWPLDLARKWLDEDLAVIESGVPREFAGEVPRRVLEPPGPDNPLVPLRVTKRPWRVGENRYLLGSAWLPEYDDRLLSALNLIAQQADYPSRSEGAHDPAD